MCVYLIKTTQNASGHTCTAADTHTYNMYIWHLVLIETRLKEASSSGQSEASSSCWVCAAVCLLGSCVFTCRRHRSCKGRQREAAGEWITADETAGVTTATFAGVNSLILSGLKEKYRSAVEPQNLHNHRVAFPRCTTCIKSEMSSNNNKKSDINIQRWRFHKLDSVNASFSQSPGPQLWRYW